MLLTCSNATPSTPAIYTDTLKLCFSKLSPELKDFFKDNKIKFYFIDKEQAKSRPTPKEFAEATSYGYSYLDKGEIYIIKPPNEQGDLIFKHLIHEIGHFVFIYLIGISYQIQKVSNLLFEFFDNSNKEGGITPLANKYLKHIYGNALRKLDQAKLFDIDIKYHEQFAEGFKIYLSSTTEDTSKTPLTWNTFVELCKTVGM